MRKTYTVTDGKLVLLLSRAREGGYVVTSILDPELITQAEAIEEAFENARDALQSLRASRLKMARGNSKRGRRPAGVRASDWIQKELAGHARP